MDTFPEKNGGPLRRETVARKRTLGVLGSDDVADVGPVPFEGTLMGPLKLPYGWGVDV